MIKSQLRESGIEVSSYRAGLLFEPDEIHKDDGSPYRVFTAFWKSCLKEGIERQELPAPASMPPVPADMDGAALESLQLLPEIHWDKGFYPAWRPGESGAQQAMDSFMESTIMCYAEERDYPAKPSTSRLSPHLHFGELSAVSVVNQAIMLREESSSENGRRSIDKLIAEVGWREFAAYTLYHAPQTTDQSMDRRFHDFPWQSDDVALKRWQQGQTGMPIIDAGMRELWHTGWVHNRVRMLVASFLTKNLMIHWMEGARWFWDTLVDADLASNSLGWQWVAGCGTDAAPYFRIFNPVLQSQKFDAAGQYIRQWVPELSQLDNKAIHEPWKAGVELDYPDPMIDLKFSRERALQTFQSIKEKPRR
jgi:deoxyribodipyrimidine photo-lyase